MKIGILTHQLGTNYGGILQNYALQKLLEEMGHYPITIDYYTTASLKIKILSFCSRLIKRIYGINIPLRGWPTTKEQSIISRHTQLFVKQHINLTKRIPLNSIWKIKDNDFDAIIVGSDQVWRSRNTSIEKFFLSDFQGENIIRLAYAASFGLDSWDYTEKETELCRKLVRNFDAISVREQSAVKLCEDHLNIKPVLVLDPTLMIGRRYYEHLTQMSHTHCADGHYIMTYILDSTKEKSAIIEKACRVTGLLSYKVMAKYHFGEIGSFQIEDCIFPPIENWLAGFKECDYVITDSFHGTVFSIVFNKPFVTIANSKRGNSRFESLLGMLHLNDRLISDVSDLQNVLDTPIDWDKVNSIIACQREHSRNFLLNALKNKEL